MKSEVLLQFSSHRSPNLGCSIDDGYYSQQGRGIAFLVAEVNTVVPGVNYLRIANSIAERRSDGASCDALNAGEPPTDTAAERAFCAT